jgi:enoyl-CoA hydratase
MNHADDEIRGATSGACLRITLNRPRALNALNLNMVRLMERLLDVAEADSAVKTIFLDGAGDRAFCAGGDIVALRDSALADDGAACVFWEEEYQLDARIAAFPKPIVAFMDGVVMGGGIGLAAHASHRVATERLVSAMPEVGIGFSPDVGSTWLLSHAPGELGTYLALTGDRLGASDAILVGFADEQVDSGTREAIFAELAATGDADRCVAQYAVPPADRGQGQLAAARRWIDSAFGGADTVAGIITALRARPESEAHTAADAIGKASPTSVTVTLAAIRSAHKLPTLEACLKQELGVSLGFLSHPDFVEGVRAQVVDKDRCPAWSPSALADVSPDDVAQFLNLAEVPR